MRKYLFGNSAFDRLLSAKPSHAACHVCGVCANKQARFSISADSFATGTCSGVWAVFGMSLLPYFGTQSRISFPAKRYF
jgi:hypothetical protein